MSISKGVMTAADVFINGKKAGSHKGGFTGFSVELTKYLDFNGDNLLAVKVDSRELPDVPPFGSRIDYMTFGGIYREAQIRVVEKEHIKKILAVSLNAATNPKLALNYELDIAKSEISEYALNVEIKDKNGKSVHQQDFEIDNSNGSVTAGKIKGIKLWDLGNPNLYQVTVCLLKKGKLVDDYNFRTGFRKCRFKRTGFYLNNKRIKLIGMNRHQTYPYIGAAGPARLQQGDAEIIKNDLKCNIVRTSHYPQSQHFLNRCG